jgi:hypothetical protein
VLMLFDSGFLSSMMCFMHSQCMIVSNISRHMRMAEVWVSL